jgi:hypothetical protein
MATTTTTDTWADTVRALLLATWGQQACQRPGDWPDVLGRLMRNGAGLGAGMTRGSMKDAVEEAVTTLAQAFGGDTLPDDPAHAVWRAFSKLDPAHCRQLAQRLIEARTTEAANAITAELVS